MTDKPHDEIESHAIIQQIDDELLNLRKLSEKAFGALKIGEKSSLHRLDEIRSCHDIINNFVQVAHDTRISLEILIDKHIEYLKSKKRVSEY